jgi:PAS domain S-box-containing protein
MTDPSQLADRLRANATLLIARERELHALRLRHDRMMAWLRAFRHLSIEARADARASTCAEWVTLMIRELHFQTAAAYRCDLESGRLSLLFGQSHGPMASDVSLAAAAVRMLVEHPSGLVNEPGEADFAALSAALRMRRWLWLLALDHDGGHVLWIAGTHAGGAAPQATLTEDDLGHFTMLGRHVTVLLRNGDLVGALEHANEQLASKLVELHASEQNFRTLIDENPEAMALHRAGRYEYVNRAFATLLGYPRADELVGVEVVTTIHPDARDLVPENAASLEPGNPGAEMTELTLLRLDGTLLTAEVAGVRVLWRGAPATVVVARDLTDRKRIETHLRLADRMVSIGTLASGIAHEINNPLTYVVGNLELLAEELAQIDDNAPAYPLAELREMTHNAQEGAERVRRIVLGLKAFSRADEERRAVLDVRRVLDLSVDMVWNEIRHRATLVKQYGDAPPIVADEARLGQVFINLLVNAAQALPDGQADRHEIRIVTRTDPDGRAIIELYDTGSGILPEHLARVFDPFFTTKPVGSGTGLGLSICHGIIAALHGEISVESTLGRGSVFRVALPPAHAQPVAKQPSPPDTLARDKRGRVLIVDDEPQVGQILRRILAVADDVVVLQSARTAVELLEAGEHFDVILCDLMMPHMTGMDFHDVVAQRIPTFADRIVFITGGAFSSHAQEFLDRVANERISKPFDAMLVRGVVRQFVEPDRIVAGGVARS